MIGASFKIRSPISDCSFSNLIGGQPISIQILYPYSRNSTLWVLGRLKKSHRGQKRGRNALIAAHAQSYLFSQMNVRGRGNAFLFLIPVAKTKSDYPSLSKISLVPRQFFALRRKNTSGDPPIPFWFWWCTGMLGVFDFNLTRDVTQD